MQYKLKKICKITIIFKNNSQTIKIIIALYNCDLFLHICLSILFKSRKIDGCIA